jgi:tetratricopeptide (TPR) repeat protein
MIFVMAATQAGADDRIAVFPVWSTFLILLVVVVELIVAGIFLKRKWLEKHAALPLPAALAMLFLMMSLYVLVGSALYFSNLPEQRPQVLFWLFMLYIPLGIQYSLNVVNSLSWQLTRRLSPVGDQICETPVQALAQKQVMAGKIEDAVATFTNFYERRAPALAEVARLLKTEGKFEEATKIYVDLVENYGSDLVVWPEAVYTLGKIYETQMGKAKDAIKLYKRLLDEAPDSRFTHFAGADMARLLVMDASFIKTLNEDDETPAAEDPFHASRRNFLMQRIEHRERMDKAKAAEQQENEEELDVAAESDAEEYPVAADAGIDERDSIAGVESDGPVVGNTESGTTDGSEKRDQSRFTMRQMDADGNIK